MLHAKGTIFKNGSLRYIAVTKIGNFQDIVSEHADERSAAACDATVAGIFEALLRGAMKNANRICLFVL